MNWGYFIELESKKDYYKILQNKLETNDLNIFPERKNIFNAFKYCSYDNTKVVIIGQDPYHGINQANGLCFSVNNKEKIKLHYKIFLKNLKVIQV